MSRWITAILLFAISLLPAFGQDGTGVPESSVIAFDHKIYDFGDVLLSSGPLSCKFNFTNVSDKPFVIHQVVSSCGCTTPEWTREPVRPGGKGTISAVFSNDQGPYPFDKTLTVYVSGLDRPVVLRLKGEAHENRKEIEDLFEGRICQLATRKTITSIGYIDHGFTKSDQMQIANLSNEALSVELYGADEGLSIDVIPNPIPKRGIAKITYTVDSSKDPDIWGRHIWNLRFKLNGKPCEIPLRLTGIVKENFDSMTREELSNAPSPVVDRSYFEFGEVDSGTTVHAKYTIRNKGHQPLIIHKVDAQSPSAKVLADYPVVVKAGGKVELAVDLDLSRQEKGREIIEVLQVITNAPSKPIFNLFLTGYLK